MRPPIGDVRAVIRPADRWRHIGEALQAAQRPDHVSVDFSAPDAAMQVIHAYLSRQHFDDVDASCPMVALPSDVARSDRTVRQAFEGIFKAMVDLFDESLRRKEARDRNRALAIAGMCVGGMVAARALDDRGLANALREATKKIALQIGGWSSAASTSSPGAAAVIRKTRPSNRFRKRSTSA